MQTCTRQEARKEFAAGRYRIVPAHGLLSMKFYYVYVLNNKDRNFIYIGYTENLEQRLSEHNNGYSKSTKPYIPLEIIHYEAYKNMSDAKRRELYLKTNRGRTTLVTMLKDYFQNKI